MCLVKFSSGRESEGGKAQSFLVSLRVMQRGHSKPTLQAKLVTSRHWGRTRLYHFCYWGFDLPSGLCMQGLGL